MRRFTYLSLTLLLPILVGIIIFNAPQTAASLTNTATPTALSVPALGAPTATATRILSRLASPTPLPTVNVPEPMLTLTAFTAQILGTFEAIPTPTRGPSQITLDGKPHYVDFYADWCEPCRKMKPAFEKMREKYAERVTFWVINVDNPGSRALVRKYRVEYIPLGVLLDKDGKTVEMLEGYQSEAELDAAIQRLLNR